MQNQQPNEMFATNFNTSNCQPESLVHEDELAKLRKENADLRNQMEVIFLEKYNSDRRCKDALKTVRELKYELELTDSYEAEIRQTLYRAHQELEKRSANGIMWSNPQKQAVATQTDDTEISKLVEKQLQSHPTQWNGERTALQNTIENLQQTQKEKQEEWSSTVTAVQRTTEEQLQSHLMQWEDERTTLENSCEKLQLTLMERKHEWSVKECKMGSRTDELESTMIEMLKKKSKKHRRGFSGKLFKAS